MEGSGDVRKAGFWVLDWRGGLCLSLSWTDSSKPSLASLVDVLSSGGSQSSSGGSQSSSDRSVGSGSVVAGSLEEEFKRWCLAGRCKASHQKRLEST